MASTGQENAPRIVVPHPAKWHGRILARLTWGLIRVVSGTLRWELLDPERLNKALEEGPAIFTTWHNRLSLSLEVYNRYLRDAKGPRRLATLVSASKDGGLLARILENFGAQPVRGSSSRRGPQALLELTTMAQKGFDLAITPDGPRGPKYKVQEGALALAQLTGFAIYPIIYCLSAKLHLRSWDNFQIPLPFARCEVRFGDPIRVGRDCSEAERESLRAQLEQAMLSMTRD